MGQKVNPIGYRIGVNKTWDANWYAEDKDYSDKLLKDIKIREYVAKNLVRASTSKSAKSRIKQLEKMERIEKPQTYHKEAKLEFTFGIDPPQEVLKVKDIDIAVGFGDERKTKIVAAEGEIDIEDLIKEEQTVIALTNFGYIKRMPIDTYKSQRRGGKGSPAT